MANLTAEELDFIKTGSAEYTKIKIGLGELELQKQGFIKQAQTIVKAFLKKSERHSQTMRRFLLKSMAKTL